MWKRHLSYQINCQTPAEVTAQTHVTWTRMRDEATDYDQVEANKTYMDCMDITVRLGLALSPAKCIPPTKAIAIDWLGFHIDANAMKIN